MIKMKDWIYIPQLIFEHNKTISRNHTYKLMYKPQSEFTFF